MELKKLPVNDNTRASYEANNLIMFPKHYMKRYKQHKTTKMTIPPKCPGYPHPLGSQTYS